MFGNAIYSFVLPLFILDISGSPALFGTVLALSFIPPIIMSPIGGTIGDRGRKQRIMLGVDIGTSAIMALAIVVMHLMAGNGFAATIVPIIIVKLIALNVLNGLYNPVVVASLPFLVPEDKLVKANAISDAVGMSVPNLAGPIVGGILYAAFGLVPVLAVMLALSAVAAVLDLFIRIPFKAQEPSQGSIAGMLKKDLAQCARFIAKEKPSIGRAIFNIALFAVFSMGMVWVALPVLIGQTLGMYTGLVGISFGVMMGGSMLGNILTGALEKKLSIQKAHRLMLLAGIMIAPIGLVFFLGVPAGIAYIVITVSAVLMMMFQNGMVFIQFLAFVQRETSDELMGKVIAVIFSILFATGAAGQLLFGMLFERFYAQPWLVMFFASFVSCAIAVYSRKSFARIGAEEPRGETASAAATGAVDILKQPS